MHFITPQQEVQHYVHKKQKVSVSNKNQNIHNSLKCLIIYIWDRGSEKGPIAHITRKEHQS